MGFFLVWYYIFAELLYEQQMLKIYLLMYLATVWQLTKYDYCICQYTVHVSGNFTLVFCANFETLHFFLHIAVGVFLSNAAIAPLWSHLAYFQGAACASPWCLLLLLCKCVMFWWDWTICYSAWKRMDGTIMICNKSFPVIEICVQISHWIWKMMMRVLPLNVCCTVLRRI